MAAEKTTTLIRLEYFWLTVVANVRKYCHSCDPCACNRPAPSHPSTRFTLSSHQQEPWYEITMEIKRPLWQEMYHRYVLVVMDLQEVHPGAAIQDSQTKQRRIARSEGDSTPLCVGDSVMMHVPPWSGLAHS